MQYQIILISDISRYLHGKGMGVYRLANHLRVNGYTVKVVHAWLNISDPEFKMLCEKYITKETILFGFSATVVADLDAGHFFGLPLDQAEERFNWIKNNFSWVSTAIGGAQITGTNDQQLKKFKYFDYAIKGQGETVILNLLDHITGKKKILFVDKSNPRILTDHIYPFQHFNTSHNTFIDDDCITPGEGLPIEIARGCIFKCKFCGYDLLGKKLGDFVKAPDVLRSELLKNYEMWGTVDYYVADETINDSVEKIDMLLESVNGLPFKPKFGGFLRLDLLWKFPEMIGKLQDWGLESCSFGIETTNDASGKAVGKGLGVQRIEEALQNCREIWQNSVFVNASFMLGLKYDTPATADQLEEWLDRQFALKNIHEVFVKPLYIMPTTGISYIDLNYKEHGYTEMPFDQWEHSLGGDRSAIPDDLLVWKTQHYNFLQANRDANRIHDKFNRRKLCGGGIAKHNMAYIKSLLPDNLKPSLLNSLINDCGFDGMTLEETDNYIRNLVKEHKQKYISRLLKNV